jgi:hypothetical protein
MEDTECLMARGATMSEELGSDILRGIIEISQFTGENQRRTTHLLENRLIPAGKIGNSWYASKTRLREHYARITAGTVVR